MSSDETIQGEATEKRTSYQIENAPQHSAEGPKVTTDADFEPLRPTRWSRIRHTLREPFAEFWGVFILVMFGDGSVAQVILSEQTKGEYQSISWGWG